MQHCPFSTCYRYGCPETCPISLRCLTVSHLFPRHRSRPSQPKKNCLGLALTLNEKNPAGRSHHTPRCRICVMLRLLRIRSKLVKLADRILPANCVLDDSIDALLPSYRNFECPPLKVRASAVFPRFCRYHTSPKCLVLRFSALLPQFGKVCFRRLSKTRVRLFRGDPWCELGGFETIPDL